MFTEQEVKNLKEIANIASVEAIKYAIDVAKDEEVRVYLQRYAKNVVEKLKDEAHKEQDPNKRKQKMDYAQAKWNELQLLFKKMYWHHAEGLSYPFDFTKLRRNEIPMEDVVAYFDTIPDPAPHLKCGRTRWT